MTPTAEPNEKWRSAHKLNKSEEKRRRRLKVLQKMPGLELLNLALEASDNARHRMARSVISERFRKPWPEIRLSAIEVREQAAKTQAEAERQRHFMEAKSTGDLLLFGLEPSGDPLHCLVRELISGRIGKPWKSIRKATVKAGRNAIEEIKLAIAQGQNEESFRRVLGDLVVYWEQTRFAPHKKNKIRRGRTTQLFNAITGMAATAPTGPKATTPTSGNTSVSVSRVPSGTQRRRRHRVRLSPDDWGKTGNWWCG